LPRYPNIGDHGLIGDLQTAALVSTDGCIDWFCCPRFDSPSVFASLLDADQGGHCRIRPDRDDYVSRQLYLPDTAILVTRFMTPDGVGEVHDFMPVAGCTPTDRHRLVHRIGQPGQSVRDLGLQIDEAGQGAWWTYRVRAGHSGGMVLEWMGGAPGLISPEEAERLADETARFWRDWLGRSTYTGRWREMVTRSAMTLKLMTYAPLTEETPDHFGGWRGSRPVRIGNGAAGQLQLDIYGEAMDAVILGDPAAAARTSPTAGSRFGWPWTGPSGWPSAVAGPAT